MNRKLSIASAILALCAYAAFAAYAGYRTYSASTGESSALASSLRSFAAKSSSLDGPSKAVAVAGLKAADPRILLAGVYSRGEGWKYLSPRRSYLLREDPALSGFRAEPALSIDPLRHASYELPIDPVGRQRLIVVAAVPSPDSVLPPLTLAFLAVFAVVLLIATELVVGYARPPKEAGGMETDDRAEGAAREESPPIIEDGPAPARDEDARAHVGESVAVGTGRSPLSSAETEDDYYTIPLMEEAPLPEFAEPAHEEGLEVPEIEEEGETIEDHDSSERPPEGLYSPASGIGWEEYFAERLRSELERAASFGQDLSLALVAMEGISREDSEHRMIADALVEHAGFRDLCFEQGESGFAAILPNCEVERALGIMEECLKKLSYSLDSFKQDDYLPLFIGLSSRAGRPVGGSRLVDEAGQALEKARCERDSRLIAFKPDPDKYRDYLARE